MNTYPFTQFDEGRLLMVGVTIDFEENSFAIDTGASQTVIDLNLLLLLGYSLEDTVGSSFFETASGIIEASIVPVKKLNALGIERRDFEVCTFDFFRQGLVSELSGLLGLDFFNDQKLCIDFRLSEITVS